MGFWSWLTGGKSVAKEPVKEQRQARQSGPAPSPTEEGKPKPFSVGLPEARPGTVAHRSAVAAQEVARRLLGQSLSIMEVVSAFENELSQELRADLKQLGNGWAMMADQYAFRDEQDADRVRDICLAVAKEVLPTPCWTGDGDPVDGGRDLPQVAIILKGHVTGGGDTVHHVYVIYPTNYVSRRVSMRIEAGVRKAVNSYSGQRQLLTDTGKRLMVESLKGEVRACEVAHTNKH
jgi:hypothetical protein